MELRTCTKCREAKETSEFYVVKSQRYGGFHVWCKACSRAQALAKQREHASRRRESKERRQPTWKKGLRDHHTKHGYTARIQTLNHAAARRGADGFVTDQDVVEIFQRQAGRCVYCGAGLGDDYLSYRTYHIDHRMPISRGGSNTPGNLQLTCPGCNLRKGDSLPVGEWAAQPYMAPRLP